MEIAIRSNGGLQFWTECVATKSLYGIWVDSDILSWPKNAEIQSEVCDIVAAHMQVGFAIVSATLLNTMK